MLTYLITGITVVVSFICFNNRLLFDKLSLKPYRIVHAKEWYRIISHGFVHADWVHLFVNMFTFWSFGKYIEDTFRYLGFGEGAFLFFRHPQKSYKMKTTNTLLLLLLRIMHKNKRFRLAKLPETVKISTRSR